MRGDKRQRLRLLFSKGEEIRYISHLDLVRLWHRALRRAGVPLAYSKGFNPRPKISLAAPLPVGFTSEGEVMEVWLEHSISTVDFARSVRSELPPGITLKEVEEIYLALPSLQSQIRFAEYLVSPLGELRQEVCSRTERLLAAESIPRRRRGKDYDLRPLIDDLRLGEGGLRMRLRQDAAGAGRPDEVVEALGLERVGKSIHRMGLIFASHLSEG